MAASKVLWLIIALMAGIVLGMFYFGGLWLTIRRVPSAQRPGLLTVCSFFGRLAVTVIGFYLVTGGRWERLLVSLLGFVAARSVAIRRWGPGRVLSDSQTSKGGSFAN